MPSAGMQYVQRKLHRSVTEIRRSRTVRPKGSTRSIARILRPSPGRRHADVGHVRQQDVDVAARRDAVAVGHRGQPVGRGRRGQLVAALAARRADVEAPVVLEPADDPVPVRLAVGTAAEALVGDGDGPGAARACWWPIIWRSAGRASSSKLTSEETGLPGRPNTGTGRSGPLSRPNANGLAGRMAICIQRMVASRPRTALTMSKSPMLTPPDVTTASHAGRGVGQDRFQRGFVVADEAEVDRRAAGLAHARRAASSGCSP